MQDSRTKEVKDKVTIPMYFYNVIVPQISDYYSDYPVDFDVTQVACCPLHDEVTPSMRYYDETNTFFCFGCRAGGDVIELHRRFTEKMNGNLPSFDESIHFLHEYFIKGKETTRVITNSTGKAIEYQSTVVDILRLSKYMDTLEKQLLCDRNIDESVKIQLWETMDSVGLLVKQNKASATEAMQSIKNKVRDVIK